MHVSRIRSIAIVRITMIACLAAATVWAQDAPGTIAGITMDDFGYPVSQVDVLAKNATTGMVYRTASGAKGEYKLGGLPPGTYEFSTLVHGVALFNDKNVRVAAGATTQLEQLLPQQIITQEQRLRLHKPLMLLQHCRQMIFIVTLRARL